MFFNSRIRILGQFPIRMCSRPVKSHGLPVSLTDFGNFSRLTAGRHNAHGYLWISRNVVIREYNLFAHGLDCDSWPLTGLRDRAGTGLRSRPGWLIQVIHSLFVVAGFSISIDCFTGALTLISKQLRCLCSRITGPSRPGIAKWLRRIRYTFTHSHSVSTSNVVSCYAK